MWGSFLVEMTGFCCTAAPTLGPPSLLYSERMKWQKLEDVVWKAEFGNAWSSAPLPTHCIVLN